MNDPHDPSRTVDIPSSSADSLDAGLAAGFGRAEPPRSSLGAMRPVLLKEAEGESGQQCEQTCDGADHVLQAAGQVFLGHFGSNVPSRSRGMRRSSFEVSVSTVFFE